MTARAPTHEVIDMCHDWWMRRERRREERFDEELRYLLDEEERREKRPEPVVKHETGASRRTRIAPRSRPARAPETKPRAAGRVVGVPARPVGSTTEF
jgi:hypothetical protein